MIEEISDPRTSRMVRARNGMRPGTGTTVVLGAGPAGLTAAYSLARSDRSVIVVEKESTPGGLCRTFDFNGSFFDLGPHVFIHRSDEVVELLRELAGDQLREITHIEGIYFEGKLYDSWFDAVIHLNMTTKIHAMLGLMIRRARPRRQVISCEDGLINSYGSPIYSRMVKVHQRKFWGVDPSRIDVSWARVYEKPTSVVSYLKQQLRRGQARSTSYEPARTYYPSVGSQVIYGALEKRIQDSPRTSIRVDTDVVAVHRRGTVVTSVEVRRDGRADVEVIDGDSFISTIPVTELVGKLRPAPPPDVIDAAAALRYRSLVVVNLIVPLARELPYGWLEVHSSGIKAGRVTNFAQLAPEMARGDGLAPICLEYYCFEDDPIWMLNDNSIIELANEELAAMGFLDHDQKCTGFVQRARNAYPMYLIGYGELRARLKEYLEQFANLQSIGRGGIHRYNNMGHSIESGLRAAENVMVGRRHDLWDRKVVDGKI